MPVADPQERRGARPPGPDRPGKSALAQVPTIRQPEPDNPLVQVRYGSIVTSSFDKGNQFHRYALRGEERGRPGEDHRQADWGDPPHVRRAVRRGRQPHRLLPASRERGARSNRQQVEVCPQVFAGLPSPDLSTKALSSGGAYLIEVFNGEGGVGRYQLLVEGTLPNNKVIKRRGQGRRRGGSAAEAGRSRPRRRAGGPGGRASRACRRSTSPPR